MTAREHAEEYAAELMTGEEKLDSEYMLEVTFDPTAGTVKYLRCCGGPDVWLEADVSYAIHNQDRRRYAEIVAVHDCSVRARWGSGEGVVNNLVDLVSIGEERVQVDLLDKVARHTVGMTFELQMRKES